MKKQERKNIFMNMQEVNPNRKYVDFLDVVELIKRIRNDEKGIKT